MKLTENIRQEHMIIYIYLQQQGVFKIEKRRATIYKEIHFVQVTTGQSVLRYTEHAPFYNLNLRHRFFGFLRLLTSQGTLVANRK